MCAVIKRGILGGFQNKIGNVVGSSWKGIATMRTLPLSVANPKTSDQVAQRTAFSGASKMGSQLLASVVKPLWDRFAQQESGYNAFVRKNIGVFNASGLSAPNDLMISKGTLALSTPISQTWNSATNSLTFAWNPTTQGDANPTDEVFIAVIDAEFGIVNPQAQGFNTGVPRSAGTVTVVTNFAPNSATQVAVYYAFRKLDGTKVSDGPIVEPF